MRVAYSVCLVWDRWKKLVGFVPQEDVMIRQLTVRDNIAFSADYRLPVEMSAAEKNQIVNDTLLSLGIDHVQHSVIGMQLLETVRQRTYKLWRAAPY